MAVMGAGSFSGTEQKKVSLFLFLFVFLITFHNMILGVVFIAIFILKVFLAIFTLTADIHDTKRKSLKYKPTHYRQTLLIFYYL